MIVTVICICIVSALTGSEVRFILLRELFHKVGPASEPMSCPSHISLAGQCHPANPGLSLVHLQKKNGPFEE